MVALKIFLTIIAISWFFKYITEPPHHNNTHKIIHKICGNVFAISIISFICYGIISLIWLLD
jgi:hypothetical protein